MTMVLHPIRKDGRKPSSEAGRRAAAPADEPQPGRHGGREVAGGTASDNGAA